MHEKIIQMERPREGEGRGKARGERERDRNRDRETEKQREKRGKKRLRGKIALTAPIPMAKRSVSEVMVMDTAASLMAALILSSTL